jgi:tetratricopeptide (TPR) repeat protein
VVECTSPHILFRTYQRTNILDYLNEAIAVYLSLHKVSASKAIHFQAGLRLLQSVIARWNVLHLQKNIEEAMQLFPEVANDGPAEVFRRFDISLEWSHSARVHAHPSISTAYETAMSLMQEALVFSPTFLTQHVRLAHALRRGPSDYASYQIKTGQFKQAIETLEEKCYSDPKSEASVLPLTNSVQPTQHHQTNQQSSIGGSGR